MSETSHDVVAIGNALVDVLSHEDDGFVAAHGLAHGAATMVDAEAAEVVYAAMSPGTEVSGGSAANTAAGIASFGGRAAFIGKVRDDQLGKVFTHDLRAAGVHFDTPPATDGPPTGRCLVVVTAGTERTMCTYLGSADRLSVPDVDDALVTGSSVTYLEGYLWDQPHAKEAILHAIDRAHGAGRRVAFTLSDPFCVDRHRTDFLDLLADHVDVVFANEHEATSLFQVEHVDDAVSRLAELCEISAVTRSEHGSVVTSEGEIHVVEAADVDEVVDVTGAGDLYAAGVLFGLTHGHDPVTAGRFGSLAAAEVISNLGARPATSLRHLAAHLIS